jgi:predicted membrane protein
LRTIEVHIGAGQVDLDLRGEPKHSYEVNVSGGVGQATVQLPKNAGIRAEAKGGIGHIDVDGLQKKGDHWENDAYETAKYTVQVKVTGGIGNIKIIAD